MDSRALLSEINSILRAPEVSPASMQVFDAIALCKVHNKQLRLLADYILKNMPMELEIDISKDNTDTIDVDSAPFVTIEVDHSNGIVNVHFMQRRIWNAKAYVESNDGLIPLQCKITDDMIIITGITSPAVAHASDKAILKFY